MHLIDPLLYCRPFTQVLLWLATTFRVFPSVAARTRAHLFRRNALAADKHYFHKSRMSSEQLAIDQRFALLRSVGEECIQEAELKNLVEKKPNIRCYDGFEPSGRMHIAQGIFKAVCVNKCTMSGCTFVFWVADWFALMNDKVGGELEKIRVVGRYLIEVWKAAGMDMSKVEFLWSSDEITNHAATYWRQVLDIGRRNTIARIKKCCTIMGKTEGSLTAAQVLYPLMQCSDIFFLKADICQLGLDQRKVNMLAREYCDLTGRKLKPVILSHHMLAGLKQGQAKMSKSDPDSAIFMEDTAEDVERKLRQAYCPRVAQSFGEVTEDGLAQGNDDKNPVLDYYQCVIFAAPGGCTVVNGRQFKTYEQLEAAFLAEEISEEALKDSLISEINRLLDPVREHFRSHAEAHELLEQVKSFRKGGTVPVLAELAPRKLSAVPHACIWMPATIKLPLDTAITIVKSIKKFLVENEGATVTLVLPDWSAFACDGITGEDKDITAALKLNLQLLHAYGLPQQVEVLSENDLILRCPNDYWVTVINVGRKNTLSHVEEIYDELKNAGQVVAALMRVADALLVGANHVINTTYDGKLATLLEEFTQGGVKSLALPAEIIPTLHRPDAAPAVLGVDDVLFLDDNEMDIRRKVKKAYSAPNEAANPVISIALHFLAETGGFLIERGEEHGDNITYSDAATLRSDCESGSLHPGDLKTAVARELLAASTAARAALTSPEGKKLSQILRNAEKKLSKKK